MPELAELQGIADGLYGRLPEDLDYNDVGIVLSLMLQHHADRALGG